MLLVKTYLAPSRIHGIGLFAAEPIAKGTVIWVLNPALDLALTEQTVADLAPASRLLVEKYAYFDANAQKYILCGDDARHFNHTQAPNCDDREVPGTTIAARDIAAGEELTCDYAAFDDRFHPDELPAPASELAS